MDKKLIVISVLIISLITSNSFWLLKLKNIEIKQEQDKTAQANEYAKKLEYQRELTKSSIETVTQETNHYMYINEKMQGEYDALQNEFDKLLKNDKCANTAISDSVRGRLFTKH